MQATCVQFLLDDATIQNPRFYYFPGGLATREGIDKRTTVRNETDFQALGSAFPSTLINLYFVYDQGAYQSPAIAARPSGSSFLEASFDVSADQRSERESVEGLRIRDGPCCILCGNLVVNNCHILDKHRSELLHGMPTPPEHGVEDLTNYITLCANHHAMFDKYVFSPSLCFLFPFLIVLLAV